MRFILSVFIVLLWSVGQSAAQTFFISPSGKDSNSGTSASPLGSLAGARDKIRQFRTANKIDHKIRVIVRSGNYMMTEPVEFTAADAGTSTAPLVITGEKGSRPVFYGGVRIKGFERVNDQLWRAKAPRKGNENMHFEQLYVNDRRAARAQYPNKGFFRPRFVQETVLIQGKGKIPDSAVQRIGLSLENYELFKRLSDQELKTGVLTFYHNWDNTRRKILRFSAADTSVYITGKGMKPWNPLNKNTLFTLENVKSGLDAPGEWYLGEDGYIYYKPLEGERIEDAFAYVPMLDQFIIMKGEATFPVSHITFENLAFKVARYQMPERGNDPMQAAGAIEATVMVDYAKHVQFVDCEFAHTGTNAIWFRKACSQSQVRRSYFHDLGAGAVKIGEIALTGGADEVTNTITVDNNIMRSGGMVFPCAVALAVFNASDNVLTHNEIADFKYSGISVGWVWGYGASVAKRNKVEFNHVHHLGWGVLSDMGAIYTLGKSEGTTIRNNVVHHVYATTYGGWGLYTDEGSTGILLENNLVYSCKSSAFHQHYGQDNIVRNNIFYNQLYAQFQSARLEKHRAFRFTRNIVAFDTGDLTAGRWDVVKLETDSNLYWDSRMKPLLIGKTTFEDWQKKGNEPHSVLANPMFAAPEKLDFKINNKQAVRQIGFKPFDYDKAGVYGSKSWRSLARFAPERAREFDEIVEAAEKKLVKK